MVRGELFRLPSSRAVRGHEQRGARYAVAIQADEFLVLSTVIVAPVSSSAQPAAFRPVIEMDGGETRILVDQLVAVDPQRLGDSAGRLASNELRALDDALRLLLALR